METHLIGKLKGIVSRTFDISLFGISFDSLEVSAHYLRILFLKPSSVSCRQFSKIPRSAASFCYFPILSTNPALRRFLLIQNTV
jgi:hypothetical protein